MKPSCLLRNNGLLRLLGEREKSPNEGKVVWLCMAVQYRRLKKSASLNAIEQTTCKIATQQTRRGHFSFSAEAFLIFFLPLCFSFQLSVPSTSEARGSLLRLRKAFVCSISILVFSSAFSLFYQSLSKLEYGKYPICPFTKLLTMHGRQYAIF